MCKITNWDEGPVKRTENTVGMNFMTSRVHVPPYIFRISIKTGTTDIRLFRRLRPYAGGAQSHVKGNYGNVRFIVPPHPPEKRAPTPRRQEYGTTAQKNPGADIGVRDDPPRAGQYSSHRMLSQLISTAILLLALAQGIAFTPSLAPRVSCGPGLSAIPQMLFNGVKNRIFRLEKKVHCSNGIVICSRSHLYTIRVFSYSTHRQLRRKYNPNQYEQNAKTFSQVMIDTEQELMRS
ncbi:hypothetical protein B0H14DRAFT_2565362 [Mycena olivaceomarginata]|nr:hypothetical protein B0H14DRAFT_2565362 [Mycena olivaceomarginata]